MLFLVSLDFKNPHNSGCPWLVHVVLASALAFWEYRRDLQMQALTPRYSSIGSRLDIRDLISARRAGESRHCRSLHRQGYTGLRVYRKFHNTLRA